MERVLHLNGTIAEESWFDDDVTPQLFKDELFAGDGDITVWINSPGGDCVAAAQIYNMLMDYKGNVTIKIDGIAASAASVIAMAGTKVLMSPVSMLMIHNPMTVAMGDAGEMEGVSMSFGKMNSFIDIVIMRKTKDPEGFATTAYDVVASVRAYREGRHGSQQWANLAAFSEATDLFRFRCIPDVTVTTDHIIYSGGEKFDITSVEDVKGRGMYTEVLAKKVVATNGKS